MFIPVTSVGGPEWWFCHESRWIRQQLCTFIPVNGLRSIMQLCISNHRVITEHEGGGRLMIIDVNVEIINKIAGNALGGLSYWTSCRTIWEDRSVKSSLLHSKSCAHHPQCSGEHLCHDGEDENRRNMSLFESQKSDRSPIGSLKWASRIGCVPEETRGNVDGGEHCLLEKEGKLTRQIELLKMNGRTIICSFFWQTVLNRLICRMWHYGVCDQKWEC